MNTCMDCLFKGCSWNWQNEDYCNKICKVVDADQPACPYFIDDSEGCCYDCDYGEQTTLSLKCTLTGKKVKNASHYRCPSFCD